MKYKILHLPTATYMYHCPQHEYEQPEKVEQFFYTEYEIMHNIHNSPKDLCISLFDSRQLAESCIKYWSNSRRQTEGVFFIFDKDDNEGRRIKKYHFEIIEVADV